MGRHQKSLAPVLKLVLLLAGLAATALAQDLEPPAVPVAPTPLPPKAAPVAKPAVLAKPTKIAKPSEGAAAATSFARAVPTPRPAAPQNMPTGDAMSMGDVITTSAINSAAGSAMPVMPKTTRPGAMPSTGPMQNPRAAAGMPRQPATFAMPGAMPSTGPMRAVPVPTRTMPVPKPIPVPAPAPVATPVPEEDEDAPTMVAPDAPSMEVRLSTCTDVAPGTRHTCEQQRLFGKCDAEYMNRYAYCSKTCGREPCKVCDDVPPTSEFNCTQQAAFGKCNEPWMVDGGYCTRTCGRAPCPPTEESMQAAAVAYARSGGRAGADMGSPFKSSADSAPQPQQQPQQQDGKEDEDFIPIPAPMKKRKA